MDIEDDTAAVGVATLSSLTSSYRNRLLLSAILMLLEVAFILSIPQFAGWFTEGLMGLPLPLGVTVKELLLMWAGALSSISLLRFLSNYLMGKAGEQMLSRLRSRLFDHLQSLPMQFFQGRKPGESLSRYTADASVFSVFTSSTMVTVVPMMLMLVAVLIMMFLLDPYIALVSGLFVLCLHMIIKAMGRTVSSLAEQLNTATEQTFSLAEENFALLPEVKISTNEGMMSGRFQKGNLRLAGVNSRLLRQQALLSPVIYFMSASGVIILLILAANGIENDTLTLANLVSLILLALLLNRPMAYLLALQGHQQLARGAKERLVRVFAAMPEPDDRGTENLGAIEGKIDFKNVSFGFRSNDDLLDGVDIRIKPGQTVAITGHMGAGKTTLTHLLMRFLDPTEGQILIDGKDISTVKLTSLRKKIGLVKQKVLIADGTVAENITFGHSAVNMEDIREAAKGAHALDFILKLPQGFDTLIGEQGIQLSGGQRQRLSLARALLKSPPILILDEASAMFDHKSEQNFLKECHQALFSRTVILITNRPGSMALADRVLALKDGRLIDVNLEELSELKGTYGPG